VARSPRTRRVTAAQARAYLDKAEEYAVAAADELEAGRLIAATSLAIHAADAVCGIRLGLRSAGQDHEQVTRLLLEAGDDGKNLERDLRRLLPMKTKAEYDPDNIPAHAATRAVERARRCTAIARRVVTARL
jgi:hypothetical protein